MRRPGGQARSGLELGVEVVLADERAKPVDGPARGQQPDGAQPEAGRPPEPLGDTLRPRLRKEASKGRPFTAVGGRLEGPDRPQQLVQLLVGDRTAALVAGHHTGEDVEGRALGAWPAPRANQGDQEAKSGPPGPGCCVDRRRPDHVVGVVEGAGHVLRGHVSPVERLGPPGRVRMEQGVVGRPNAPPQPGRAGPVAGGPGDLLDGFAARRRRRAPSVSGPARARTVRPQEDGQVEDVGFLGRPLAGLRYLDDAGHVDARTFGLAGFSRVVVDRRRGWGAFAGRSAAALEGVARRPKDDVASGGRRWARAFHGGWVGRHASRSGLLQGRPPSPERRRGDLGPALPVRPSDLQQIVSGERNRTRDDGFA